MMVSIANDYSASTLCKYSGMLSQSLLIMPRENPLIIFHESIVPVGNGVGRIKINNVSVFGITSYEFEISGFDFGILERGRSFEQLLLVNSSQMCLVAVGNVKFTSEIDTMDAVKR